MEKKIKIDNKLRKPLFFIILCCCLFWYSTSIQAYAEESPFSIKAELLPSDNDVYDIQVTVENLGTDWEGIVRLRLGTTYGELNGCAFDTVLALPQGSKKQFSVKIPTISVGSTNGTIFVNLVDKNDDIIAQKEFTRLLFDGTDALLMGILSDNYDSLTYMDMGGEPYQYNNNEFPIKLVDLNQDSLDSSLVSLTFLVIDSYNTSILTEEKIKEIELWTENGGMLIVGTGNRVQDTLSGLDFLGITCTEVLSPGDSISHESAYFDTSQIYWAELDDIYDTYSFKNNNFSIVCSRGDGSVGIVPYSFSELGSLGAMTDSSPLVNDLLNDIGHYANSRYGGTSVQNSDYGYNLSRFFRIWGNGEDKLHFGTLKAIVILYVIFVGPILYLILKFLKKRDFYWIAVPLSTLLGVLLIYLSGRGFEVINTNVYSVTVEDLSHREKPVTYLHSYDSSHKEWSLRLSQNCEYAGPSLNTYFDTTKNDKYTSRIKKEGERFYFGLRPSISFEDGYFTVGNSKNFEDGSIISNIEAYGQNGIRGTITNQTSKDFAYFAVIMGDRLRVYKNLPSGECCDLSFQAPVFTNTTNRYGYIIIESYLYDFLRESYNEKKSGSMDLEAALGMGICTAYYYHENIGATLVVGVTQDWENIVDDNCSEESYGCVYTVQK